MRFHLDSVWDILHQLDEYDRFIIEVVNLDKAHKRAKKELRKQQKAIAKKNAWLDCYKYMLECSQKRERELEIINEALLNELSRLKSEE